MALSNLEQLYFNIMKAQTYKGRGAVLYTYGQPGIAKSAIYKSIAEKTAMNYIPIHLSMVDETDVGIYPDKVKMTVNGEEVSFLDHIVPLWAKEANEHPCIIHFEELNRSHLSVRNAALQILLDRQIGTKFKFNENVFMCASGNIGEDDGTEVDEFDNALYNRLCVIEHIMEIDEWVSQFAEKEVHPSIIDYVKNNPSSSLTLPSADSVFKTYATYRSWTFLSDFIQSTYSKKGEWANPNSWVKDMDVAGVGFIGSTWISFKNYVLDAINIKLEDIIKDYDSVKDRIKLIRNDRKQQLISDISSLEMKKINSKYYDNILNFISDQSSEDIHNFLQSYSLNVDPEAFEFLDKIKVKFKSHVEEMLRISTYNERNRDIEDE